MKKISFVIGCSFLSLSTFFISCKRGETNAETFTSIDQGIAESYFNDMYSVVNSAAAENNFAGFAPTSIYNKTSSSDCPTVTFSAPLGEFPNTMTIDFGASCISYFGIERSGKIVSTFTGPYAEAGTIITTIPEDYYVNGSHIEGTKTVSNLGLNDAGNIHFSVIVSDGIITLATGEDITWNGSRIREWIEGSATMEILDDVYSITGGSEGINRMDIPFTSTIVTPLRKEMDCKWIVSGEIEITPLDEDTRNINYGEGTCDNLAILTVGAFTTTIELPF